MADRIVSLVTASLDSQTVEIEAGRRRGVEVGMRFRFENDSGRIVGLGKVTEVSDASAIVRQFDPFVDAETLARSAFGAGVGAVIGTMIARGVVGGAMGALLGGTFGKASSGRAVKLGMKAVQVVGGEGLPALETSSPET